MEKGHFRAFTFDSLTAKLDYTRTGVRLDARLQQNATQWLTAKGFAPMTLFRLEAPGPAEHVDATESDRIDLRVESSPIDLGVIQGVTSLVTDVRGSLQANVHVTGSGRDPHLEGAVTVRGGAFKVPAGGVSYTGFDTRIDLQPDKAIISGFELRDDNGDPLLVSGELAMHERALGAFDLQFQADSFELVDNEFGDVEVDSLHSRDRRAPPSASGGNPSGSGRAASRSIGSWRCSARARTRRNRRRPSSRERRAYRRATARGRRRSAR